MPPRTAWRPPACATSTSPGAYGGLGERHATETHLIPLVLQVASGKREEILVFGTDWPTPDGTCIRDYIHVRDLADAHVLALQTAQPGSHRIYNLGNGTGFSVREVIACCERVVGKPIAARDVERRAGDPAVLIASSEKAVTELGWRPHHTGLDEIVADAWEFTQSRELAAVARADVAGRTGPQIVDVLGRRTGDLGGVGHHAEVARRR